MKTTMAALALALFASTASASTITIDGCEAFQVEGANYYNFTDPTCVTGQALNSSSNGEDARVERAAAAAEEAAKS